MNVTEIGIDLGGTKVLFIAGKTQLRAKTGRDFTPEMLKNLFLEFIQYHQINPELIGIAAPGLVENNQVVLCDVLPHFTGWSPKEEWKGISAEIGVFNDIKAALFGEFSNLSADFSGGIVMVGTAIGAAFISNGKEINGINGWAGEFGYFPFPVDSGVKRLDELSGGHFLAEKMGLTSLEMFIQAMEGNKEVLKQIHEGGYYLGMGLASLVNFLNPEVIAIGGGTALLPGYWEGIMQGVEKFTIPMFWKDRLIRKVEAGEKVAAIGAVRRLKIGLELVH
ncbi:ROK family protein [Algoriphagus pacificus]|uniref:ROK family protein n=1 Tax=Algoriphagus pacificus TaxID=2811234 RepID=A0ABS3CK84_9BACT|nr:ROK family protein [Algoriphagus pacificus]MBN7816944.1 ROK family protein [Algoriphagus pacificus]